MSDVFKFENFPGGYNGITFYWAFCEPEGTLYYGYTIGDCYVGEISITQEVLFANLFDGEFDLGGAFGDASLDLVTFHPANSMITQE